MQQIDLFSIYIVEFAEREKRICLFIFCWFIHEILAIIEND